MDVFGVYLTMIDDRQHAAPSVRSTISPVTRHVRRVLSSEAYRSPSRRTTWPHFGVRSRIVPEGCRSGAGCLQGYWTTRGYANSWIANSRTGRLADWSTRGLDNSRTGQVADWTTRGCHRRLYMLSFGSFGGICETASCPVTVCSHQ